FGPFPDDARRGRPVDERAIGTRPVDTGADRRAGDRLGGGDRARLGVIPRRLVVHPSPIILLDERLLDEDLPLAVAASVWEWFWQFARPPRPSAGAGIDHDNPGHHRHRLHAGLDVVKAARPGGEVQPVHQSCGIFGPEAVAHPCGKALYRTLDRES